MKKKFLLLTVVISLIVLTVSFAGCSDAFNANDIRALIENNLGWHKLTKTEVASYDAFDKDGKKIGEYTMSVELINKEDVKISAINSDNDKTLKLFTGYKFVSSLTIDADPDYVQIGESYTGYNLSPVLSYTRKVQDGKSTEIFTSYGDKKAQATFIIDGKKTTSESKYATSIHCDNTFLYQFARATDMSTSLSVNIPSYTITEDLIQVYNQAISVAYSSNANITLDKTFILNKEFNEVTPPSGAPSGETPSGDNISSGVPSGEITSGDIIINNGALESGDKPTSTEDESGNIITKYPYTETSSIPVKKCTFTASKDLNIKASVQCFISTNPIKNELGKENAFINRVIVMIKEGDITYKLTSVEYK